MLARERFGLGYFLFAMTCQVVVQSAWIAVAVPQGPTFEQQMLAEPAGDLAADAHGEVAMTASDLLSELGAAVKETTDSDPQRSGDRPDSA